LTCIDLTFSPQRCIFANRFSSTLSWRPNSFCSRARIARWASSNTARVFTAGFLRCNHADPQEWRCTQIVATLSCPHRTDLLVQTPRTYRSQPASVRIAARDLRLGCMHSHFLDEALPFHSDQIIGEHSCRNHFSFARCAFCVGWYFSCLVSMNLRIS
jgi:hypothetical protein